MSKESLRKQFEKIKSESELALADKSTPAQVRALFTSLISLFEIVIIVFLEKKPRKTSSNSGLPPSHGFGSNGNRNTTITGRQNVTNEVSNVRTIETTETITPEDCQKCGADLSAQEVTGKESRLKIDIIYEVIHHTVTCVVKECKVCGGKKRVGEERKKRKVNEDDDNDTSSCVSSNEKSWSKSKSE